MLVLVVDIAFACTVVLNLIQHLGDFFVMALAHTWRLENGDPLKDRATHMPKKHYRCYWVAMEEACRRRDLLHLYQAGVPEKVVTIILRKQQRHGGPKHTKIPLTNLPDMTVHQVVDVYQRGARSSFLLKN